jgi:hypothetical protein
MMALTSFGVQIQAVTNPNLWILQILLMDLTLVKLSARYTGQAIMEQPGWYLMVGCHELAMVISTL